MKANETHISLETAKLLKDCGIDSELFFYRSGGKWYAKEEGMFFPNVVLLDSLFFPAYTWQEILWENTDKFFKDCGWSLHNTLAILRFLQEKKYEEADLYFRNHCILINK